MPEICPQIIKMSFKIIKIRPIFWGGGGQFSRNNLYTIIKSLQISQCSEFLSGHQCLLI